jgi:nucleoid-associated protein EbfC
MLDLRQIQKIQKDLQDRLDKIQEELKHRNVEGTSGGGVVTVTCNGRQEVVKIKIQPEAVDPKDIEMLEDLVLAAANSSLEKARELHESMVNQVTGGIKLPGLF